tara:strand:+ start:2638 stop:3390 length:753 start_codon:yes stop_codon:yes gene_type:complete
MVRRDIEALTARITDLEFTLHDLVKSFDVLMDTGIKDDEIRGILASSIHGEVTNLVDGKVVGWAKNAANGISPLPITVFYGGKKICSTLAVDPIDEGVRDELVHGRSFSILLPRQFYDGKSRMLQIKAGSVGVVLENKIGAVKLNQSFPIEGNITSKKGGVLEGWVIDKAKLSSPVLLSLKYGQETIAKVMADLKLPNLAKKFGRENVHHGFKIKLPERFGDGKKRNFRLQISPWGYDVFDKPIECKFTK